MAIEATVGLKRRIKRDYTIPVRLNQPTTSCSGRHPKRPIAANQTMARERQQAPTGRSSNMMISTHMISINQPKNRPELMKLKSRAQTRMRMQVETQEMQEVRMGMKMRRGHRFSVSSWWLMGLLMLVVPTLLGQLLLAGCDTVEPVRPAAAAAPLPSSTPRPPSKASAIKSGGGGGGGGSSSKESLLSSLAQTIELQHFVKSSHSSKQPARLSKFDASAQDNSYLELGAGAYSKSKGNTLKAMAPSEPDGMSQILRMHESANLKPSGPLNTQQTSLSSSGGGGGGGSERFKRWRSVSRVSPPLRSVATSLINKPNKMVTQVLSYITPLVGSKLTNLKLHPFAGRSLSQLGELDEGLSNLIPAAAATTTAGSPSRLGAGRHNRARSTKSYTSLNEPTTLIDNHSSSKRHSFGSLGGGGSSGGLGGVDEELKDLMADSSSLSSFISSSPLNSLMMSSDNPSSSSASLSSSPSQDQDRRQEVGSSSGQEQEPDKQQEKPAKPTTVHNKRGTSSGGNGARRPSTWAGTWLRQSANQVAQSYFQNSFRDLITLSQLPILSASTISTAPSVLEKKQSQAAGASAADTTGGSGTSNANNKRNKKGKNVDEFRRRALEELYRYAYILATGVKNKRDPLSALASKPSSFTNALANYNILGSHNNNKVLSQRSINQLVAANQTQLLNLVRKLRSLLSAGPLNRARPRGVMWDMATDPSLAVTVFHLLERASVALPLGFMLMPVIQMMRNPLNSVNFGRLLPARASHRSVDYEELAKRLDVVDKILSRALRQTHREGFMG